MTHEILSRPNSIGNELDVNETIGAADSSNPAIKSKQTSASKSFFSYAKQEDLQHIMDDYRAGMIAYRFQAPEIVVVAVNDYMCEMMELDKDNFIGAKTETIMAPVYPDDIEKTVALTEQLMSADHVEADEEYRLISFKTHRIIWFHVRCNSKHQADGSWLFYFVYVNITQRKRLEDELTKALRKSNTILNHAALESNDFVAVIDLKTGKVKLECGSWYERGRATPDEQKEIMVSELFGDRLIRLIPDEKSRLKFQAQTALPTLRQALKSSSHYIINVDLLRSDGSTRSKQYSYVWLDRAQERILIVQTDITSSVEAQRQMSKRLTQANNSLKKTAADLKREMKMLRSFRNIYEQSFYLDIQNKSIQPIEISKDMAETIKNTDFDSFSEIIHSMIKIWVSPEFWDSCTTFLDYETFGARFKDTNLLTIDFQTLNNYWWRGSLILVDRDEKGMAAHLILALQNINTEKQREIRYIEGLRDVQSIKTDNEILRQVALEANDFIAVIDVPTNIIELRNGSWYSKSTPTPENMRKLPYPELIDNIAENFCIDQENSKAFRKTFDIDTLCKALEGKEELLIPFSFLDATNKKSIKRSQFRITWLDRKHERILVTRTDITKSFEKDQQLIIDDLIMKKTALDNVDFVAVLDPKDETIMLRLGRWVTGIPTPEDQRVIPYKKLLSIGSTYTTDAAALKNFYEVFSVSSIMRHLQKDGEFTIYFDFQIPTDNNLLHKKRLHYTWLNDEKDKILVTRTDITDSVAQEQKRNKELKDALEAAQQASQAKSTFFSCMSHDIRTPMNAIIGFSMLLLHNADDPDRVRDEAKKVLVSSNHLLGLINDVLDMSKIESGRLQLNENKFLLSDVLSMTDSIMRPEMEKKHQKFDIYVANIKHEMLISDENRLQQILINLLSNATKYTNEGGEITLRVNGLPQSSGSVENISFEVRDNGRGMSEAYQKVIFTPFSREEQAGYKESQGTGLGLAITRNLVNIMGGTISVISKLGVGTTFTVIVPFGIYDSGEETAFWEAHSLTHMLAVDDEREVLGNIVSSMEDTGVRLELAENGTEAIACIEAAIDKNDPFDIVLLDWMMPGMNGIECARKIRKEISRDVLIIILTAYDYSGIETEAREAGVDAFMQKPFFSYNLMRTVKKANLRETHLKLTAKGTMEAVLDSTPSDNSANISITDDVLFGLHILAAEDNELNAELLKEVLKDFGADVVVAPDGKATLEHFEAEPPGTFDVILMDVQMPVMDGYATTRAIRSLARADATTIPIIAMTANAFNEDVQKCLLAGMNAHVAKPLNIQTLRKTIEKYVRGTLSTS